MARSSSLRVRFLAIAVMASVFAFTARADVAEVRYALDALQAGKIEEAIDHVSAALSAGGLSLEEAGLGYNVRGLARLQLEDYSAAAADLDVAVALAPNLAPAWANRGLARAKLERYADAIADFDKALSLQPGTADFLFLRGNARYDFADYEGAIADYSAATQVDPNMKHAHQNRCDALNKLGRLTEAVDACAQAAGLVRARVPDGDEVPRQPKR